MTATKTFFKTDDGSVNHGNNIEALSISWGDNKVAYVGQSAGGGQANSLKRPEPTVTSCHLMFRLDGNMVMLQNAASNGKIYPKVTISYSKQIGRGWSPYMVFKLKDVLVSGYSMGGGGGGTAPICSVSLSFTDISFS